MENEVMICLNEMKIRATPPPCPSPITKWKWVHSVIITISEIPEHDFETR